MEFAQRLKQTMENKSITMYRLAKELGVHQTTIKNWLNGKGEPRLKQFQHIASALDVDVNWLMNGQTLEQRDQAWKDQVTRRFEEATQLQKQRSHFKPGKSYFGGDVRVTNVTISPEGKETITVDMDIGKLSAEDMMGYLEMFNKMAKLGITVDGISRLIDAASNIANTISNPSQEPAQQAEDTTPPPESSEKPSGGPETPPEGK